MKLFRYIPLLMLLLALTSCGGDGQPVTLEGKKRLLDTKRAQLKALNQEIGQLEAAILKEDPTLQAEAKRTPVQLTTLAPKSFKHMVSAQGVVAADQNIQVSPLASGRITKIYVREGQSVKSGQVLAQLDDAVMRSSIEEVETQLELANTLYEKQKRLWDQQIGTEVQYLTASNQKKSLEKRLATLKEQLDMSRVKAPISGTVDEIYAKTGELVSPGVPSFQLINFNDLKISADLPEVYVPYVKRGDEVTIAFATLGGKVIQGRVSRVGQAINPMKRTFLVEVKLPSSRDYKPNMFGEILINDRTIEDAIAIPQNIVQKSDVGEFVYVAEKQADDTWIAKRVNIETGLSTTEEVEVTNGLTTGDHLISVGYKNLSAGQEVVPERSLVETNVNTPSTN